MIKDKEKAYGALYQRTSRNLFIRGEKRREKVMQQRARGARGPRVILR
jgi:hypothetical protein